MHVNQPRGGSEAKDNLIGHEFSKNKLSSIDELL